MSRIVLKVDVDTLRGTRMGVPRLARLFERAGANATFLFSLGPDHTGWALRRVFRPGFLGKVARTSVIQHYGLITLLYGTLLPAPDIGKRCVQELRAIAQGGFECGIHCWDHVYWQDNVRTRNREWTHEQMQRAYQRFEAIFEQKPRTHGAAGWQMNEYAFNQIDKWGMNYASDGRGTSPYRVALEKKVLNHIQMPTTLPTFDELLGRDNMASQDVVTQLLNQTKDHTRDEVFTLHAELEGQALSDAFEALLNGWRAQGHQLISMADYYHHLQQTMREEVFPIHPVNWGTVPGRSGELILQS